jgi:DNA ligase (NAD+)
LGIEGAGLTTWEKIVDEFSSLDAITALNPSDLEAVSGFAEKSAIQIVDGLAARAAVIKQLLGTGVQPVEGKKRGQASQSLAEMQFVITGGLSRPRAEIEELIKDHGGKLGTSVSKHTSAVITNETDSQSSKMQKAKSLGTPIWTEQDLIQRLSGS